MCIRDSYCPCNNRDPWEYVMSPAPAYPWSGVYPAATTQFDAAGQVDLAATAAVQEALVRDGVHGLVLLGTVGENNSLSAEEKRAVLSGAVKALRGSCLLYTSRCV